MHKHKLKLMGLILLSIFSLSYCYTDVSSSSGIPIDPTNAYQLQVLGENVEVYEFTPKARTDFTCVAAVAYYKAGLSCFPKKD